MPEPWHGRLRPLFENAPSLAFFALLRQTGDLRVAGWCGALLAAIVSAAYLSRRLRPHPIILGINLYLALITPLAEGMLLLGRDALADSLVAQSQSLVLVAIFGAGLVLTLRKGGGFVGVPGPDARRASMILLAVSLAGIVWTFTVEATRFVETGLPILALFATRHALIARAGGQSGLHALPLALGAHGREPEPGA
ncbi:hypothetical protein RM543_16270 [Roseicyclus sp. F158]|uniref:Uncharacterized protein n=1 Tax=Tropicimonas omnivorans TaxID=3075590 RepID=A0ABU3DKK2_9RHOB|nr:hypothetical protein [Roseicyclus sp. F158]MDT0684241.1 hypothetical protein [Roseicyclus sp. F158]